MGNSPDLSLRARKILQAVVSEYLRSGEAVGSRTISRRQGIQLSPATVRNVMSDLEELGLLDQPHTSAGRVPTESGLRFFIDSLLKLRGLSTREKDDIRQRFDTTMGAAEDLGGVVRTTSRLLAEITHHAGIVLMPNPALQRLRHIEFRPLSSGRVLCILVTTEGQIENRLVHVESDVEPGRLERIHNYLDALLGGMTLEEIKDRVHHELGKEQTRYDGLASEALELSKAAFDHTPRGADLVVTGQANLLEGANPSDPETMDRMRELLRALEDKKVVVDLLDRAIISQGIQVFLGAETAFAPLGDSSVVAVPYGSDERPLGAIAVIGPMRMNYGKVMSIVDFTADIVSEVLSDL